MNGAASSADAVAVLEWNEGGHHDTHLRIYVEALLRLGRSVAVLCVNPSVLSELRERTSPRLLAVGAIPKVAFRSKKKALANWLRARRHGRAVRRALGGLERSLGRPCGQVFLACIYDSQVQTALAVVRGLGLPWTGMYLQAHWFHDPTRPPMGSHKDFPITRLFADARMRGLLMLDEGVAERVRSHTGRPVWLAPDFADETDGSGHPLGCRYRGFAGGRPLVASLGHLQPSKGCLTMAELALRPDARDLVFLFAGGVIWPVFNAGDRALFVRAVSEGPAVIYHGERVPDERAYNSLVQACDVLFAAYVDFPHSSNTLTKAAVFEKPIVVSDGHLMAARVREYRLGEVVPQGDSEAALRAIRSIVDDLPGWRARAKPRWAEYRERHSVARLNEALAELLSAGSEGVDSLARPPAA